MASSGEHALKVLGEKSSTHGSVGGKEYPYKEAGDAHKEHDYVMVGEDSSREQSSCPTPVGTPFRSMLPGDSLHVSVPSTDVSPQTVFGSLDPKGLAALQAAFHNSFVHKAKDAKEHGEDEKEAMQAACESIEGLVVGQAEVVTPVLHKERKPIQDADSSPEGVADPKISFKAPSKAAPGMKEHLEEAQKEIEHA